MASAASASTSPLAHDTTAPPAPIVTAPRTDRRPTSSAPPPTRRQQSQRAYQETEQIDSFQRHPHPALSDSAHTHATAPPVHAWATGAHLDDIGNK